MKNTDHVTTTDHKSVAEYYICAACRHWWSVPRPSDIRENGPCATCDGTWRVPCPIPELL
jgi:hypothetical protein